MPMLIITRPTIAGEGEVTIRGDSGAVTLESAIHTCSHCQKAVEMHRPNVAYGYCRKCDHTLCEDCAKTYTLEGCLPFKAKIDAYQEAQYRAMKSYPIAV